MRVKPKQQWAQIGHLFHFSAVEGNYCIVHV